MSAATEQIKQELAKLKQPQDARRVEDFIARMAPELEKALPTQITAERFGRIVLTEVRRNPSLRECSPESLLGAMMLAAQLGLEPGPLGHVYFVPFAKQIEFIIGYKGYIDLAYRSEKLKALTAKAVYADEEFDYVAGSTEKIIHRPKLEPEGDLIATYAIATLTTGGKLMHVSSRKEIAQAKAYSASGRKNTGPWVDHFVPMARKTAIRQLAQLLPLSASFGRAMEHDETEALEIADVIAEEEP